MTKKNTTPKNAPVAIPAVEGSPFTLGGQNFTLQYLTYGAENLVCDVITEAMFQMALSGIETTPENINAGLRASLPALVGAILADQAEGFDAEWVAKLKGRRISETLHAIFSAQFELSDLETEIQSRLAERGAQMAATLIQQAQAAV